MNGALEQKLIECLDALDHGRPVDQILARYPDDAVALRPMLETAVQLGQLKAAPSTAAKNASRQTFLAQAAALQSAPRPTLWAGQLWHRLWRGLVPVMGVATALLLGVLLLANAAIPGEPLYGVKLQLEDWRLSLARDPETIQALTTEWEARRLAEVQQLLAADLQADVVFGDDIASIASDHWMLKNGIRLNITDQTVIVGKPEIGAYLHIEGRTVNGAVEAGLIHVGEHHSDLLDATPVPATETPTPTTEEKPDPTITLTPTPIISPSPTVTPSPTTPTATSTLEGEESSSSAVQDDGSSDSDDNGDDNSGSGSGDDTNGGDDNSGSDSGDDDDDGVDDNSGSDSGDDDDNGDDDNSGSSSGDEDDNGDDDDGDDDNSGSGSGDDDEDGAMTTIELMEEGASKDAHPSFHA